jgi:hypothetical protein
MSGLFGFGSNVQVFINLNAGAQNKFKAPALKGSKEGSAVAVASSTGGPVRYDDDARDLQAI